MISAYINKPIIIDNTRNNYMIDIETLGVRPGSIILQIGCVRFNKQSVLEEFKIGISKSDSIDADFTQDESTMKWWREQPLKLYSEVSSGKNNIITALTNLNYFIEPASVLWSKWSHFDMPILLAYYDKISMKFPVHYRDRRCYGTVTKMFPWIDYDTPETAHDALKDAVAQAEHLIAINKEALK